MGGHSETVGEYDGTHDRRLIQRMQGIVAHLATLSDEVIGRADSSELDLMHNEARSIMRALEKEHPE